MSGPRRLWDVFVDGEWVGRFLSPPDYTAEQVKAALPDEYPRQAVVKPARSRKRRESWKT